MTSHVLTFPGETLAHGLVQPVPLQRPRSGLGRVYDTSRNRSVKRALAAAWKQLGVDAIETDRPVELVLCFMFQRPRAHYVARDRARGLRPDAPTSHTQTPDLSNLAKLVEDALNGIAYADDAQIESLKVRKGWCDQPGFTLIVVSG